MSQDFVSTDPQLRNLVLEEFTGIHCGNCPGGHKKAKEIAEMYPGRVVLVSIHEGSYAVPYPGEPDFRTEWGQAFLQMSSVTAFPCGLMNRQKFSGQGKFPYYVQREGGMALSVNGWKQAVADQVLNGDISSVNIAARTNWNNETRELTIEVEAYFTDDVSEDVNINIALLESHIWGPQTAAPDPKNYEHNHMLRDMVTGQWGEEIATTTKGTLFKKSYTYPVNEKFNIINCDLALFITEKTSKIIITGTDVMAIPPSAIIYNSHGGLIGMQSNDTKSIDLTIENKSNDQKTFELSIEHSESTPSDWVANIQEGNEITIEGNQTKLINFIVETSNEKGVGDYIIRISEKDNPISNPFTEKISYVTTDINYLEINAGGSDLMDFQKSRQDFISLSYDKFNEVSTKLVNLDVVVWNCGPKGKLGSEDATFIDNMIKSGIGFVFTGSGAIPSLSLNEPKNALFNTLGIIWEYGNEIDLQEFSLVGTPQDEITNGFKTENLSVADNGYLMQATNITNPAIATPILLMKENQKVISTKIDNTYSRSVYLGFNLAIIKDESQRVNLESRIIDWIEGKTSINESSDEFDRIQISVYPNIVTDRAEIVIQSNDANSKINIGIFDILGRKVADVFDGSFSGKSKIIELNTSALPTGIYYISVFDGRNWTSDKIFKK
jgi:outer membrane protein Omp28/type IX secretion system substrate protein